MPVALKVVHDASCSAMPSLRLQLNTSVPALTVDGPLTAGGVDVVALAASVASLQTNVATRVLFTVARVGLETLDQCLSDHCLRKCLNELLLALLILRRG